MELLEHSSSCSSASSVRGGCRCDDDALAGVVPTTAGVDVAFRWKSPTVAEALGSAGTGTVGSGDCSGGCCWCECGGIIIICRESPLLSLWLLS